MEELHDAAIAYYSNVSDHLQMVALDFFRSMDVNGDSKVSLIEFVEFLQQRGYHWISPNLFFALDRDGDGYLDFWEVLTMYYMVKTRTVCCRVCGTILIGLYFTCVVCFDSGGDAYDICPTCYQRRMFSHPHNFFLDSYLLLRSRRGTYNGATNLNLAHPSIPQPLVVAPVGQPAGAHPSIPQPLVVAPVGQPAGAQPSIPQRLAVAPVGQPARIRWLDAFQALEVAVFAIGGLASFGCTIM